MALAGHADKHHRRVKSYLQRFTGRPLTTWPALAEAYHFLSEQMQIDFLRWADVGGINVVEMHESTRSVLADWNSVG